MCQEHICSESTFARQVCSSSSSSSSIIVHAAPHSGSQCFTILIQRKTFSQLPHLPSLCFALTKKKRGNQWNQGSIGLLNCQAHLLLFKKDDVKFNGENSYCLKLILPTSCWNFCPISGVVRRYIHMIS